MIKQLPSLNDRDPDSTQALLFVVNRELSNGDRYSLINSSSCQCGHDSSDTASCSVLPTLSHSLLCQLHSPITLNGFRKQDLFRYLSYLLFSSSRFLISTSSFLFYNFVLLLSPAVYTVDNLSVSHQLRHCFANLCLRSHLFHKLFPAPLPSVFTHTQNLLLFF